MSVETLMYGTGWKTCTVCGLTAPDLVGEPLRCALRQRCDAVKNKTALSSIPNLVPRGPMKRFELDADEQALVELAVVAWRAKVEAAGAPIVAAAFAELSDTEMVPVLKPIVWPIE